MKRKMHAAAGERFGKPLDLRKSGLRAPEARQILVTTEPCRVCHTDLHDAPPLYRSLRLCLPFIPGHEGIGLATVVGAGVTVVNEGDLVGGPWLYGGCGHCEHCLAGWETVRASVASRGFSLNGGFAEYMLAQRSIDSPRTAMRAASNGAAGKPANLAQDLPSAGGRGAAARAATARPSDLVAHDLKNIFNSLGLYLELVQRSAARGDCDAIRGQVAAMKQSIHRGVEAIGRLQRQHGPQDGLHRGSDADLDARPAAEELDLNDLVREACAIAKPTGLGAHRVRQVLAPAARIFGCSTEIVNALVNLAVNAFEAFDSDGCIASRPTSDSLPSSWDRSPPPRGGTVTFETGLTSQHVWVLVADDGPGMPPEVERRAFEPFFTTKGDRGTGLGLAIVHGCMQRHGGRVTLETAAGRGARFTLVFPSR